MLWVLIRSASPRYQHFSDEKSTLSVAMIIGNILSGIANSVDPDQTAPSGAFC